jgi:hypothetical protein
LDGVFGFGTPTPAMAMMNFSNTGAAAARMTGGQNVFSTLSPRVSGQIATAAMGGQRGLQMLSAQYSYEASMASAGISAAGARLSHEYAMNTTFPMRKMDMEMDNADKFGGVVSTEWMQKNGIPAYNAGRGYFAWAKEQMAMQKTDLAEGNTQNMARLGWQLEDIGRERGRSRVQFGWQRQDLADSYAQTLSQRAFQSYEFGRQREDLNLQRQYFREDSAFNRQVSDKQFGWQMEDYDEAIRRSSGRERKQLVKQRDRATEMQNMQRGQEDKQDKRQEEAFKREEEHMKKVEAYQKEQDTYEDANNKKQLERLKVQEAWREEDFSVRESRVQQEMEWAQANHDRQLANFKIREEQLAAEESKANTLKGASEKRYNDDFAFEQRNYQLQLASAGLAAENAKKQYAIQLAQETIQKVEEDRIGLWKKWFENTQWGAAKDFVSEWKEFAKSFGFWKEGGGSGGSPGGKPGKIGDEVKDGDFSPGKVTPAPGGSNGGGAHGETFRDSSLSRPRGLQSNGGSTNLVIPVVVGQEKIEEIVVKVLPDAVRVDRRRSSFR